VKNLLIFTITLIVFSGIYSCKKSFDPVSAMPKIIYRSFESMYTPDIYIMDIDGSNKKNLTKNRYEIIMEIGFFPDGKKIIYGYEYFVPDIGIIDLEGNIILETDGIIDDAWYPIASPDGSNFAFICGSWRHQGPIYIMNLKSRNYKSLVPLSGEYLHFDFSPDGSSILYGHLWSVNISDTNKTRILAPPGQNHKFLNNGSKIVFLDYNWNLFIMDSNGSNSRQLTFEPYGGSIFDFELSPKGTHITYVKYSQSSNQDEIFIIDIDGNNETCLTESGGKLPKFSPDGKKIAYAGPHPDAPGISEIFIMDIDGQNRKNLTNSIYLNDDQPVFQPVY
jgi:Tol biopolymer transport system component